MLYFCLPAPWDIDFQAGLNEKFRKAGGFFNYETKLWCISQDAELPDGCQAYFINKEQLND